MATVGKRIGDSAGDGSRVHQYTCIKYLFCAVLDALQEGETEARETSLARGADSEEMGAQ